MDKLHTNSEKEKYPQRNVRPVLKIKLADYKLLKQGIRKCASLTIWSPNMTHIEEFKEGNHIMVSFNFSTNESVMHNPAAFPECSPIKKFF